jgi:hypothetical protein
LRKVLFDQDTILSSPISEKLGGGFYKLFIVSNPIIEIVSHELILTNKKELQIRLFDVLEELEIDEM